MYVWYVCLCEVWCVCMVCVSLMCICVYEACKSVQVRTSMEFGFSKSFLEISMNWSQISADSSLSFFTMNSSSAVASSRHLRANCTRSPSTTTWKGPTTTPAGKEDSMADFSRRKRSISAFTWAVVFSSEVNVLHATTSMVASVTQWKGMGEHSYSNTCDTG